MNQRGRASFFYLAVLGTVIMLVFVATQQTTVSEDISLNRLAADIQAGLISRISENNDRVTVVYAAGPEANVQIESSATLVEQLIDLGVTPKQLSPDVISVEIEPDSMWVGALSIVGYILPFLLIAGVFWFVLRQMQGSNNAAMSFGKSKARMFAGDQPTVTFDDVAGAEEAKEDLLEVVEFLQEPEKFIALGARIPKGVLLVGIPGTGKTLIAKAVSGEAGVPFFSISGSEFVEMFVGVGASRVRDLFEQAKRHSPCIIFIDEIDAVGRQRGAGLGGSHDEREQTLNQMLVEMDGFDTDTNVIMIAATNRPDILDPALLRPGRFDRRVMIERPDVKGREAILDVHVRGKPLHADVDLSVLARATQGFVGADIENLVNEAAIMAARKDKKSIEQEDFESIIERIMLGGPERRSQIVRPEEQLITAYHEAGHAIVSHVLPNADPVHKITIIPRGMAKGYMLALPEEERQSISRNWIMDRMAVALGGRIAEELFFDDITAGASADLESVTDLARNLVMRWGMSGKLGNRVYGKKEEIVFLGREISEQRNYSEAVAEEIDREILTVVGVAYEMAKTVIEQNRGKLEEVAKALLEMETLTREDFEKIFPPIKDKRSNGIPILLNGANA